ncbi:amidohydrolase [Bacillus rubiinfantis]|uniref:amidohydrolase n=1 Tax=Bacillus rubiinfantis TaxID=1499680 RepID=UPI0005A77DD8|nr:amidohydrolase [Bacillus rubiinfantis]
MVKADTILKSNHIFTAVNKEAMDGIVAVKGNKVIYVGNSTALNEFTDSHTQIIDCTDKVVLPGFIDAHVHFLMSALFHNGTVKVIEGTSEQECVDAIGDFADKWGHDEWVATCGWYLPLWEKQVLPTKASLDAVFPDRPVAMLSGDLHTVWLNTRGLEKLGITKDSVPPKGGKYGKDKNGNLTGILFETAGLQAVSKIFQFNDEILLNAYKDFLDYLVENGVTTVCDVAPPDMNDELFARLFDNGELSVRINMYPELREDLTHVKVLREKYHGDMLKFGGLKQFFDGVSGTHTAYLSEPYANAYYDGDVGRLTIQSEEMEKLVMSAVENDMGVRIHTIGDGAIHCALDIFEKAEQKYGKKPHIQHTLEHLENIQEVDIKRLHDLNVVASVQPAHTLIDPAGIENDLGLERAKLMWAFRDMLDSGVTVAFGTDSPVVEANALRTLYYAVTRENLEGKPEGGWQPHQKITMEEALIAHTYGSARAAKRETELGTLEVGKLADIIVLDRNILEKEPKELLETKVELTMTNGRIVYQALSSRNPVTAGV